MLSVEIKVNGTPVAVFHARNTGSGYAEDVHTYDYTGADFPLKMDDVPNTKTGKFAHKYHQGIVRCVYRMLEHYLWGESELESKTKSKKTSKKLVKPIG
jgi:hypothetical protein